MSGKYDDEIREVEARLVREREALRAQARNLTATARRRATSPKGLLAALAIGYVVGELTAPKRRERRGRDAREQGGTQPAAKALGIGGLLGSAMLTFVRQRYGSPWILANRAWHYYQMHKEDQRRAARSYPARPSPFVHPSEPTGPAATARTMRADSGVRAVDPDPLRKTHAAS